jgi:CubicO group peptidase (beta-lactamase class C family)
MDVGWPENSAFSATFLCPWCSWLIFDVRYTVDRYKWNGVRHLLKTFSSLVALGLLLTLRSRSAETYWPTQSWRSSTPEAQGFDSEALASALKTIRERNIPIHSLLIERNGYLVLDTYFFPFKNAEKHDMASATKSIMSTLVGIAIGQSGLAGVEQPVLSVFHEPSVSYRDACKERLTIEDLLTMRSGLDCRFDQDELTLRQMRASAHWVPFMLNLPMVSDPGRTWVYCSGGMHLLSGIISEVSGHNAFVFAQQNLFAPLNIRDASWPSDPDGVSDGWGDLHLRPRDMAKIGYLWLHSGDWEGRQIVPPITCLRRRNPTLPRRNTAMGSGSTRIGDQQYWRTSAACLKPKAAAVSGYGLFPKGTWSWSRPAAGSSRPMSVLWFSPHSNPIFGCGRMCAVMPT